MGAWHVRAIRLPEKTRIEFWTENDRISFTPVSGADTLSIGGYVMPGLVDAHTHPGSTKPGAPLDEEVLTKDLEAHRQAGVTLIRVPGVPQRLPGWAMTNGRFPRILDGGPWLFTPGMFFAGWGNEVAEADLPDAAVDQARAGDGWVKLRGDCIVDEATHANPPLLAEHILTETVRRVHEAGGRVSIHSTHAEACRRAVAAGVDTLEHGMWLDHGLLRQMASLRIALTPTYTPWARQLDAIHHLRSPAREWFLDGYKRLGPLSVAAHAAGVTILAGSDSRPHGAIADEVRSLAAGGLPPSIALGAACWTARAFFGVPGIAHGAPADFVVFAGDPLADLEILDTPSNVVLNGQLVHVG